MDDSKEKELSDKLFDLFTAKVDSVQEGADGIDELFERASQRAMELYPNHTFVDGFHVSLMKHIGTIGWKTMEDILEEDGGKWKDALAKFLWHDDYTDIVDYFAIPNAVYDAAIQRQKEETQSFFADLKDTVQDAVQDGTAHIHRDGIYHSLQAGEDCGAVLMTPPDCVTGGVDTQSKE